MAAISPRKKVEWTGNALRPYLFCSAVSCRRSSSQPTRLPRGDRPSVGSAGAAWGGVGAVGCVSSMCVGLLGTNRTVERTVGDDGAVWSVGDGDAWQRAVGRTAADRGVISRGGEAAVARTEDEGTSDQRRECRARGG